MIDDMIKAHGWITSGWTLADGKWIEVGHVAGIKSEPEPLAADVQYNPRNSHLE